MIRISQCMKCKHKHRVSRRRGDKKSGKGRSCNAFPSEIPLDIYLDELTHDKVMESQVGEFTYEPLAEYVDFEQQSKRFRDKYDGNVNY